jgi:hypothetical protein
LKASKAASCATGRDRRSQSGDGDHLELDVGVELEGASWARAGSGGYQECLLTSRLLQIQSAQALEELADVSGS